MEQCFAEGGGAIQLSQRRQHRPDNPAGRLIEGAGAKGLAVGAARVSEQHGNFIVNTGGATARDIETLIREVQRRVHEKFGVELLTEVRIVGEER